MTIFYIVVCDLRLSTLKILHAHSKPVKPSVQTLLSFISFKFCLIHRYGEQSEFKHKQHYFACFAFYISHVLFGHSWNFCRLDIASQLVIFYSALHLFALILEEKTYINFPPYLGHFQRHPSSIGGGEGGVSR